MFAVEAAAVSMAEGTTHDGEEEAQGSVHGQLEEQEEDESEDRAPKAEKIYEVTKREDILIYDVIGFRLIILKFKGVLNRK